MNKKAKHISIMTIIVLFFILIFLGGLKVGSNKNKDIIVNDTLVISDTIEVTDTIVDTIKIN